MSVYSPVGGWTRCFFPSLIFPENYAFSDCFYFIYTKMNPFLISCLRYFFKQSFQLKP